MSPAFLWTEGAIFDYVESVPAGTGRIWLDCGGREGRAEYVRDFRRMKRLLERCGCELRTVFEPDACHHEAEWARRFPDAMRFFLGR